MTSNQRFAEDLIIRARQHPLDADEEKSLQSLFETSPETLVWYDAGVGFDTQSPVLPGDEELLARLVDSVVARRRWRLHALKRVAAPTLGALLVASSAAAAGWVWRQSHMTELSRPTAVRTQTSVDNHRGTPPRSGHSPIPTSAETAQQKASFPTEVRSSPRAAPLNASPVAQPTDAADLFARASRARREGRVGEAMSLYERLCARQPQSHEAAQAHLALGELNLQQGKPATALQYFKRYGGQAMIPEALWGQARALRLLSKFKEERTVVEILRDRYPNSPYTAAALRRLSDAKE